MDAISTLAKRPGAFEAGRPRSHDQHRIFGAFGRDDLWMPALAPFLAHCGILGAADRRDGEIAADADVAADAFADVLETPFLDLLRQEGVGDGGPRRADEIEYAAPDLRDHAVRRGEAADADDRLRGQALDEGGKGLLRAF